MIAPTLGCLFRSIFWGICGDLLAHYAYKKYGVVAGVIGFLFGGIASYLLTWAILIGRLLLFYPLPICRRGKCRDYYEYHWPLRSLLGWEWWGKYRYRCNCDEQEDEYVRKGKQFLIVGPNKELIPYKKLIGFREWGDDNGDT